MKDIQRTRYSQQRDNARRRGIPFLLTFAEWWSIWRKSGRWNERGTAAHQYQMCRLYDQGAYEVGNVKIVTCHQNHKEQKGQNTTATAARGERHGLARMTVSKVRQIRREYTPGNDTYELAAKFGILPETVRRIANRITWSHVS